MNSDGTERPKSNPSWTDFNDRIEQALTRKHFEQFEASTSWRIAKCILFLCMILFPAAYIGSCVYAQQSYRKDLFPPEQPAALPHPDAPKYEQPVLDLVKPAMLERYGLQEFKVKYSGPVLCIKIKTDNPREVGPDLIVDAVAAFELYGGPGMVVDFGTATTYVTVNEKGEFFAGVVSPGIRISAKALWEGTAKLPEIEIKKPESILATETISSMQAGLIYGQIGQSKYIINEMKKAAGCPDMKVVATGGLGRLISEETEEIDIYDPILTLKGLQILYEKNRKHKPQNREFDDQDQPE